MHLLFLLSQAKRSTSHHCRHSCKLAVSLWSLWEPGSIHSSVIPPFYCKKLHIKTQLCATTVLNKNTAKNKTKQNKTNPDKAFANRTLPHSLRYQQNKHAQQQYKSTDMLLSPESELCWKTHRFSAEIPPPAKTQFKICASLMFKLKWEQSNLWLEFESSCVMPTVLVVK